MARVLVRFGELSESLRILRQAIEHLASGNGELATPLPAGASGAAFGWAEAAQGELVIWVEVRDGLIHAMRVARRRFVTGRCSTTRFRRTCSQTLRSSSTALASLPAGRIADARLDPTRNLERQDHHAATPRCPRPAHRVPGSVEVLRG